jgi:hypothetical protein
MQIAHVADVIVEFSQTAGQHHSRHASGQAVQSLDKDLAQSATGSHNRMLKMEFFDPTESYRCWLDASTQADKDLWVQAGQTLEKQGLLAQILPSKSQQKN